MGVSSFSDGLERFAEFFAKGGGNFAQLFEDIFLAVGGDLFARQVITGLAIYGVDADDVLAAPRLEMEPLT